MRIDFHSNVADRLSYCCRLIRKAYQTNCHVTVFHPDSRQLRVLDEALWTISEQEFIAHAGAESPQARHSSVLLTAAEPFPVQTDKTRILLNLSQHTPQQFALFERMIEIVSRTEDDIQAGRQRYRSYQQSGHELHHFQANA